MTSPLISWLAALLLAAASITPLAGQPTAAPDRKGPNPHVSVESRIAELRTRLQITEAQQPQWNAFTQVMRENAAHMQQVLAEHGQRQDMSALDDLRAYAAIAEAHAQDMQRLVPAFQTLYEAMSPDQKQLADTTFRQFQRSEARRLGKQ
jgi:periplasmic protein CpxP/Spy